MEIESQERDDALLKRSAKGDENALTILYRRHQAPLFRFAMRMTGNFLGRGEIVQDVFMTLVREPKKFDPESWRSWRVLVRCGPQSHHETIGTNTPKNFSLEQTGDSRHETPTQLQEQMTPAHWAELRERREQVRAAVLELPVEFRHTVVLCELEEMSYEETARALDCPVERFVPACTAAGLFSLRSWKCSARCRNARMRAGDDFFQENQA